MENRGKPMENREFEALGIPVLKEWMPVPEEWKAKGRKEVPRKVKRAGEPDTWVVVVYERPNEPDIELWSHSLKLEAGKLMVRIDHVEAQAESARKRR